MGANGDNYGPQDIVQAPTFHLDVAEIDPCWLYDPLNMPIADWSRINTEATNATVRQILSTLNHNVDRDLGLRYAGGYAYSFGLFYVIVYCIQYSLCSPQKRYEEAQLAVRLVDFLVKSTGCLAFAESSSISFRWKDWHKHRWMSIWREEVLDRVGPAIMNILRSEVSAIENNVTSTTRHYPYECLARQMFRSMCQHKLPKADPPFRI